MMSYLKDYKEVIISTVLLAGTLAAKYMIASFAGQKYVYLSLYALSYIAVGGPVWVKAFESIKNGTIFSEFLLMGIATVGAFAIGEYAEGVAVMLFYMVGEYAQGNAVHRARRSIKSLIDSQPEIATVERNGTVLQVAPKSIETGEIIRVKPGEKVPLDGVLLSDEGSFNTAALTGESKPMTRKAGEEIWAGSINRETPVRIEVTSAYEDTKLSNILKMVKEAAERKAPTERFMTRFAKVYTPLMVWLAVALTFIPYLFVDDYVFRDWLYRALIFLVVSCPCGLVISIPLGYFGGIGAASRNGILFKGANFLDQLRKMNILFMDKTGTMTKGEFKVQEVYPADGYDKEELIKLAASLEQQSTHPIAKAIVDYSNGQLLYPVENQQEVSGKGLIGTINQKTVAVGNRDLLNEYDTQLVRNGWDNPYTYVHVAEDGTHVGTISIADRIKEDSKSAIQELHRLGVEEIIMLSGDKQQVVDHVAKELGLDHAFGGLMPDDKYNHVKEALNKDNTVGFIGDGVNDAPVITLADIGIAMGGIGSDATVETADVVIQTDQPSKIPTAIEIANFTHRVVWQNIGFALGIKLLVMGLAAIGIATMWEAIFADVGVALLAIGNALRIQHKYSGLTISSLSSQGSEVDEEMPQNCCEVC
ncbi:heavy metal translocating P-type ATPase [Fodinibius halophilus]|uniref:P-type Zn(2+) transporter n=1 Tax=Fodinibius halophilus TaxID=1736908 RepID=A0A6M1TAG2_9BACT|nr:heavy metal translocating P-type ATPase [Fodinibius halophilus]NGP87964.1 cadmium-translocating P-type ATPase [Fodinibius halophilus]